MKRTNLTSIVICGMALFLANAGRAAVPGPPVNQNIGMPDMFVSSMSEADCRICHSSGTPDRHHLLEAQPIPSGSIVPFPDADGDGVDDKTYSCLNCHDPDFTVVRDCTVCHSSSAHHATELAQSGNCTACHGDIVDNIDDGHYIPNYEPSLVTPYPSRKPNGGLPDNIRKIGAGNCNYCHDDDGLATPIIITSADLHHATGLGDIDSSQCNWCHDPAASPDEVIRVCERCHGLESLHNIQADSTNPQNIGTIVVGGEDLGFGHVGRDAGPGDSDCWGCHGFGFAASSAPQSIKSFSGAAAEAENDIAVSSNDSGFWSGPIIPTISGSSIATMTAGSKTEVVITGSAFFNIAEGNLYSSDVAMTAEDGTLSILLPDSLEQGEITVTIPEDTVPGNYNLQAVKEGLASNPVVISVRPELEITEAICDGGVTTVIGSGFSGYAKGLGPALTAKVKTARSRGKKTAKVEAEIIYWDDNHIEADFGTCPKKIKLRTVFGKTQSRVSIYE